MGTSVVFGEIEFAVQLYAAFIRPVQKVIEESLSSGREVYCKRKTAWQDTVHMVQTLYLHRKINRLYCRMLN